MTRTIRTYLEGSRAARNLASLPIGGATSLAVWENDNDRISYDSPRGHAFSYYLAGGTGTRRLDAGPEFGHPGTVCIMPEGQNSDWEITKHFRFVHLYVSDDQLRGAFARIHDCDARRMDLPETTFADMPALSGPLSGLAKAAMAEDLLMADALLADLVACLATREIMLRGGLPARLLRQIDDWIEAHLDQPIRLDDIAQEIGLSPYHLHRMFRATRGIALHGWVTNCRIARAKSLLAGPAPVVDIAFACGFSSQSHFARVFKAHTTCTPGTYRRLQSM